MNVAASGSNKLFVLEGCPNRVENTVSGDVVREFIHWVGGWVQMTFFFLEKVLLCPPGCSVILLPQSPE